LKCQPYRQRQHISPNPCQHCPHPHGVKLPLLHQLHYMHFCFSADVLCGSNYHNSRYNQRLTSPFLLTLWIELGLYKTWPSVPVSLHLFSICISLLDMPILVLSVKCLSVQWDPCLMFLDLRFFLIQHSILVIWSQ
jgi:hypothetical protein